MRPLAILRYDGGNQFVDLDEEVYKKEVEELKYSLVGRIFLSKGSTPPTTIKLKNKLGGFGTLRLYRWGWLLSCDFRFDGGLVVCSISWFS